MGKLPAHRPKALLNAILVAEPFHFLRHLMWAFHQSRVRVMKLQKKNSCPNCLLDKYWKIFTECYSNISNKHIYDHTLKYHITHIEICEITETFHTDVKMFLAFKITIFEAFRSMNARETREYLNNKNKS